MWWCVILYLVNNGMGNASIIIVECMIFRNSVLATKNNKFLNLEIEGD